MENFTEILIESTLILAVFYLGYSLLLSRETNFRQNRFFLLTGLIFSTIIPFVQFPALVDYQPNVLIQLKTVEIFASGKQALTSSSFFTFDSILKTIYFSGVLFLIVKLLYQLWIISKFRINAKIIKNRYGKVVYTGKRHPVFSFLNYVFVDVETENSKELEVILEHERVHIVQLHSIDLLLLEVLAIVQWFNPMVWLYLKSIRQNHEYLADRGVIKNGFPLDTYQYVLLNNYSALGFGFANSFNHSLTFKRLIMMKKIKSNKLSAFKLMLIIPVVLAAIYMVSCSNDQKTDNGLNADSKEVKNVIDEVAPPPPPPPPPIDTAETFDSFAVTVKPEFPGGEKVLIQFIAENTVYPKEALEKGIQGTVYVRFLVSKGGKVAAAKVMRAVDPLLETEALRVVNSLPEWKPGEKNGAPVNIWFIIPVKFKLK
jgi:TonB family protein